MKQNENDMVIAENQVNGSKKTVEMHYYKYKVRAKRERDDNWTEWAASDDLGRAKERFEYCRDVGFYASLWEHVDKLKYKKFQEGEPTSDGTGTPRDNSRDGEGYMPTQDELQSSVQSYERVRRFRVCRTNAFKRVYENEGVNIPKWVRKLK